MSSSRKWSFAIYIVNIINYDSKIKNKNKIGHHYNYVQTNVNSYYFLVYNFNILSTLTTIVFQNALKAELLFFNQYLFITLYPEMYVFLILLIPFLKVKYLFSDNGTKI